VLPDAVLVTSGRNYVAVIGSPEGTATAVVRVSAISSGVCGGDQFTNELTSKATTYCFEAHGVQVVPGLELVVHFQLTSQGFEFDSELSFAVFHVDRVFVPVDNMWLHGFSSLGCVKMKKGERLSLPPSGLFMTPAW